jgi:hypothetical protein
MPRKYDLAQKLGIIPILRLKNWYLLSLRNKIKDWMAGRQENGFEWRGMSTCGLCYQYATKHYTNLSVLV